MERIPEANNIPEKQIRRADVSSALLEMMKTVPYIVNLDTIAQDSIVVPKRKRRGLVRDVLAGVKFKDLTDLKPTLSREDSVQWYLDYCLERRSQYKREKYKPKEGYRRS